MAKHKHVRKYFTPKELAFIEHFMIHGKPMEAYIHAGYSDLGKIRNVMKAQDLLKRPRIKAEIDARNAARKERTNISEDLVLQRLWTIASADATEIVSVKVSNCRYCWGANFDYQYTSLEWETKLKEAEEYNLEEPAPRGGHNYTVDRAPHPDCPQCFGAGKKQVMIQDTQNLSPQARMLYAGAEETRYGVKVKMHDQLAALVKVADHLGMFESKTIEAMRQAQLKKIQAETDAIGKELQPVKVEINVVDASNPERVRGEPLKQEELDDTESES